VNLQLDHFPMILNQPKTNSWFRKKLKSNNPNKPFAARALLSTSLAFLGARLSQRVAMDDLASYFVEERSKVR